MRDGGRRRRGKNDPRTGGPAERTRIRATASKGSPGLAPRSSEAPAPSGNRGTPSRLGSLTASVRGGQSRRDISRRPGATDPAGLRAARSDGESSRVGRVGRAGRVGRGRVARAPRAPSLRAVTAGPGRTARAKIAAASAETTSRTADGRQSSHHDRRARWSAKRSEHLRA